VSRHTRRWIAAIRELHQRERRRVPVGPCEGVEQVHERLGRHSKAPRRRSSGEIRDDPQRAHRVVADFFVRVGHAVDEIADHVPLVSRIAEHLSGQRAVLAVR
jgi:hypothetical protein